MLGTFSRLSEMVQKEELDCIVLNTRILDVDRLNDLEALCQQHSVSLLRLQISMKPFIAAGLLERGKVSDGDSVDTGDGVFELKGREIHVEHHLLAPRS